MAWYISKIVFRIVIDENPSSQFDEQIRLIEAQNLDEAFVKSCKIGLSEEQEFYNIQNQKFSWVYVGITHVYQLNVLNDGVQFYSLTNESAEADNYEIFVKERMKSFEEKSLNSTLNLAAV